MTRDWLLKLRLTVSELPVGALRYIAKRVCIGRTNGRVRNRRETHRARCVAIAGGERMQKKLARTQRNIKGQKRGCGRGSGGGRPSCSRNHRRRSRAHNLPIGTLHYSCLQLQPANQPGPSPARILSPAPVHCCIPPAHPWFPPLPAPRPVICFDQIQLQSPRWFWINHQFCVCGSVSSVQNRAYQRPFSFKNVTDR